MQHRSYHHWHAWRRCIGTRLASPHDINRWDIAPTVTTTTYELHSRSVVLLTLPLAAEG
jgi:hypothetical protein